MMFKKGDILLTYHGNIISNGVRKFLSWTEPDPVYYSHAILIVSDNVGIQAWMKGVGYCNINSVLKKTKRFVIYRSRSNDWSIKDLLDTSKSLVGKRYGYFRGFLMFLDQIFDTKFSKKFMNDDIQVCSSLVAYCWNEAKPGTLFNNKTWSEITPDDIDDECKHNTNQWEEICSK